jgi:hypothetical protein
LRRSSSDVGNAIATALNFNQRSRALSWRQQAGRPRELRRRGSFRFGNCFGEKIQNALNARRGDHQIAPETRLAKKLVSALEEISVAFPSIFANDFDGERFVAVITVDAGANRALERHKPVRQLVYSACAGRRHQRFDRAGPTWSPSSENRLDRAGN